MANPRICSIPDCGKPHDSKGYCNSHYFRLRKHGDPLGGRTPRGELMRFIHEVALNHSSEACLTWPFGRKAGGYGMVLVDGKKTHPHRYICGLANGAPPTPEHQAAHSCGNGHEGCIAPGHLSWKTCKDNHADKLEHGTHGRGERNSASKLTEADVHEIISVKGKISQSKLAAKFGVAQSAISKIQTGRAWGWLSDCRSQAVANQRQIR